MILVVALSHLLLAAFLILFRADSVAETALALGGPFCHRLARLIDLDCALGSGLLRLLCLEVPYQKNTVCHVY